MGVSIEQTGVDGQTRLTLLEVGVQEDLTGLASRVNVSVPRVSLEVIDLQG